MSDVVKGSDLSAQEKRLLFWASFLSLAAAGFGFAFRVAMGGEYATEFELSQLEVGQIFGATLWPIAITMIGFSLVVDRTGYKIPMYAAFVLQTLAAIGTAFFSTGYESLWWFALCAGLGHGIVEAVINPICAAVYPKEKTKWLTILHAAWPAGLVFGTLAIIWTPANEWRTQSLWMLAPAVAYLIMYIPCKFPVDERVQAGVPYREMLRQVGFLTAFLASFLMVYEIGNQLGFATEENWMRNSAIIGGVFSLVFGFAVGSMGKPLFFLMCLLMIPVATAELGTDGWIKGLMAPVLEDLEINPAMALVFSASIMLILRVFAGGVLKFFSPPGLLCVSGIFSAVGLYWLGSTATGTAVFIAFVLYALGQTYYWPCVLGFTSERYPEGGALTLNTVSAIGLLSAGIIGTPILGAAFDKSIHQTVAAEAPAMAELSSAEAGFFGIEHEKIDPGKANAYLASLSAEERTGQEEIYEDAKVSAGRDVLSFAVRFPAILFLVFGAIALYFRSRGGYKPIILTEDAQA